MKFSILFGALFICFSEEISANSSTLCEDFEEVYFSCLLENKKIVSVCAQDNFSPDKGYVSYRYGSKKKIELEFPSKKQPPDNIFNILDVSRLSAGRGIHLKFKKNNYEYVLSNALVPGQLYVVRGDDKIFDKTCLGSDYIPFSLKMDDGIRQGVEDKSDSLDNH